MPGHGTERVFVDHAMLDRYGFGDASSLAERVVFFTQPDDQGWVHLLPVQRRVDYAHGSAVAGWFPPPARWPTTRTAPAAQARHTARATAARSLLECLQRHLDLDQELVGVVVR
jgi:hypothetical protein